MTIVINITLEVCKQVVMSFGEIVRCCQKTSLVGRRPYDLLSIAFLVVFSISISAQDYNDRIEGEVTFTTSDNVYIRFLSTEQVTIGDTLFKGSLKELPCLKIERKSSISVIGIRIQDCGLKKGDKIYVRLKKEVTTQDRIVDSSDMAVMLDTLGPSEQSEDSATVDKEPEYLESIRGRISSATYSSISPSGDRHRAMMRFSLSANHINNSKFSLESYLNYRQNFLSTSEVTDKQTKFFRVYNLSLRYDVDPTLSLSLGRRINRKVSSLGAIDGLQVQKYLGKAYVGAIVGFRPDLFDHSLNPRLLEYGAYAGFETNSKSVFSETTFGLLEQRNSGQVDRRYGYLQHSSTINRNLNLFTSLEVDLYANTLGISGVKPRVTSLYSSARYRFNRNLSLTVSYDTRKRIIFYETLRTDIEELLTDDIARQGLRFRLNARPIKNVFAGVSYSKRFQSDQQNKSDNVNGFVSISRLPGVGGRLSINYNRNQSHYLESQVLSFRHARTLIDKKLDGSFYYRQVNYTYTTNENTIKQNYIGANLTYRFSKRWVFSVLGERTNRSGVNSFRINTRIIKRF